MTLNNIFSFALQNFYQLQTRSIQYLNIDEIKNYSGKHSGVGLPPPQITNIQAS